MAIEIARSNEVAAPRTTPQPAANKADAPSDFVDALAAEQGEAAAAAQDDESQGVADKPAAEDDKSDGKTVAATSSHAIAPSDPAALMSLSAMGLLAGRDFKPRTDGSTQVTTNATTQGIDGVGDAATAGRSAVRPAAVAGAAANQQGVIASQAKDPEPAETTALASTRGKALPKADALPDTATTAATRTTAAQALAARDDTSPAARMQALAASATLAPQPESTIASATLLTPAKAEKPEERRLGPANANTADALNTSAPDKSPWLTPVDATGAAASGTHANMAERMVDQMSWWLSQKTQNAELSLGTLGGAPVSVSVQVQGNEAHIAFRSDHPDARQALTQALPQLKDMLGSEGLMLSGASVGSHAGFHGTAQGDAKERDGSQPQRLGTTTAIQGATLAPAPRAASAHGLDLYV